MSDRHEERGPVAFMAKNRVTANLVMIFLLLAGIFMSFQIKQEVFPEFSLDTINISLNYPGASPEEVERGTLLVVEEEVQGIEGIKEITSTASEGSGSVSIELLNGVNPNKVLQDVRGAVDRIRTFPVEMENYTVSLAGRQRQVMSLMIYGDQSERALRDYAEKIRSDLLAYEEITIVELSGVRRPEISIEIPRETLRAYNLTMREVAQIIDNQVLEIPAGTVKTDSGEIMLRTSNRKYWAKEYNNLPIITEDDGTVVVLSDIATIKETFEDSDLQNYFNGNRAVTLNVYRVGEQTPSEVSEKVNEYLAKLKNSLPEGVYVRVMDDMSVVLQERIDLLFRNAMLGVALVLVLLGLFLEPRLAFWVTLGIPVSVIGTLFIIPVAGVSINMISLFAFIITIGVVVDDAIVVGEHVYTMRQRGMSHLDAAIAGTKEMLVPVTFSILTNIMTFTPLFFVPGMMGKIFFSIPVVVISIYAISLFESLFILPAHLSHKPRRDSLFIRILGIPRKYFSVGLEWFINKVYKPLVELTVRWRYASFAFALAILFVITAMTTSGKISFVFMESVDSDVASASLVMPIGTTATQTKKIADGILAAAEETIAEFGGGEISEGIMTRIGGSVSRGGASGAHNASIQVYLKSGAERDFSTAEFANKWSARVGQVPGSESLTFSFERMNFGGKQVDVELSHTNTNTLEAAASDLAERLQVYDGIRDIDDGYSAGKTQLDFNIRLSARSLGLTATDIASQIRSAFYGAEALRNQRGRDEVKVYVRLPKEERTSLLDFTDMLIRTPTGGEIPLTEAAEIVPGKAYTQIRRRNGHRVLNVQAGLNRAVANENQVLASITENELPELLERYPGLTYSLRGRRQEQNQSLGGLMMGFVVAMMGVYLLLAIPFKSYIQPLIIMVSIPFGFVGATIGHWLMGFNLSLMSLFGIVALSGVVVNDSLILIVQANKNKDNGMPIDEAVVNGGVGRFRPIMLTSLTTFIGLAPMIFETSIQAQFLIPMAISLGFGILFATFITLLVVPSLYVILDDLRKIFMREEEEVETAETTSREESLEPLYS